jgi:signal transduction histidine kinase
MQGEQPCCMTQIDGRPMSTSNSSLFSEEARLLEGNGRQVVSEIGPLFSDERLQQVTTQDERMRLARELHDGVLQSLMAAVLQLETVSRLIETDPNAAKVRLSDVQRMIGQEQRELRAWTERLDSAVPLLSTTGADLAAALGTLRQRLSMRWGLRVELTVAIRGTVSRVLGDEICRIVQEALNNVGRHARAGVAHVSIRLGRGPYPMRIAVADNGCGFPFRGRFDLADLTTRQIGPKSLRERVASLGGELILTSELSGSRLEISLPLVEHPGRS